jgi:hypothetical protein
MKSKNPAQKTLANRPDLQARKRDPELRLTATAAAIATATVLANLKKLRVLVKAKEPLLPNINVGGHPVPAGAKNDPLALSLRKIEVVNKNYVYLMNFDG